MVLVAMTEPTSRVGTACFITCVALMFHAIVWGYSLAPQATAGRASVLLGATVEFLALWLWLSAALPILAWMFWIGDNEHWFYHYAWLLAAVLAAGTASITARRALRGAATRSYRAVHFWVPLCLLAAMAGVYLYDFVWRIEGRTAEAAAHNILARMPYHEPVRLVELTPAEAGEDDKERRRAYWIMGIDEPRGRIVVGRYGRFWWTLGSSGGFPPSQAELSRAKEVLEKTPWESDNAVLILRTIVENYPRTPAAAEARELLESLAELSTSAR